MKNYLMIMVLLISGIQLSAQHGLDEFEKFRNYLNDPGLENFISAVQHYESNKEENFTSNVLLANMYLMEFERNISALEAEFDSLSVHNKFSLANLLLEAGRYQRSLEIYDDLTENYPKWSCPWRHKGEAYLKTDQLEAALEATLQSIETREDHYDAYIQLAEIQKKMGNYQTALQSLEKGLLYRDTYTEDEISDEDVINLKKELQELIEK